MMVGWILFYSSLFHSDVERKVCKCFSLVASLENLASVTGFAGSSCSFLIANALSVHLLAQWVTESAWTFMSRAGRSCLAKGEMGLGRGVLSPGWVARG